VRDEGVRGQDKVHGRWPQAVVGWEIANKDEDGKRCVEGESGGPSQCVRFPINGKEVMVSR
jgi:hypothetical protein